MSSSWSVFGIPSSAAEKLLEQYQYEPSTVILGFASPVDSVQRPEDLFPSLARQRIEGEALLALMQAQTMRKIDSQAFVL